VRKSFGNRFPDLAGHSLSRRRFVSAAAAAMAFVVSPFAARAARKFDGEKVVFASWGGSFQDAQKVAFCEPFSEATGATVVQAGPITYAKLRAMLESGTPTWDVVDIGIDFFYSGAADKLFDRIDTGIVDVKRIDPRYLHENGVGDIVWSYNLGYGKSVYTEGNRPRSWADFFDLQKFPGRRMIRDRVTRCWRSRFSAMACRPTRFTRSMSTVPSGSSTRSRNNPCSGRRTRSRSSCSLTARRTWA